jgi:AraC-like DNA-binding protein
MRQKNWNVHPGWKLLLNDVGINPANLLRRAGLPGDLFVREKAMITTEEYFSIWRAIEQESNDPSISLRIGSSISVEAFDPPIFAALCSPDLNTALTRLAYYKRLICPMKLHVDIGKKSTTLVLEWQDVDGTPPSSLMSAELVFFVHLARIATRSKIQPLAVRAPHFLEPKEEYSNYFGVQVTKGPAVKIVFKAADASRPFLTVNDSMWKYFEPELQRRLSELENTASLSERVQAALLEMLPSGSSSMDAVSKKLCMSPRTVQRKLRDEGQSFQFLLNKTRSGLAKYYLKNSTMTGPEISFLLGYDDPNSFFRAFHTWTGETPEKARMAMAQLN